MARDSGRLISGSFPTACQECRDTVTYPVDGVLLVVLRTETAFYLCAYCFSTLMEAGIEAGVLTGRFRWIDENGQEARAYP